MHAARLVAATDARVFISGERGAGRQALAGQIHALSERRSGPLRVVNCAGMPEPELEAEFASSFDSQQPPATLMLHQVDELSAAAQCRLLHYLKITGQRPAQSSVRLIVSAGVDLQAMVERGDFRSDLFYALYVVPLEVPPLRERREDIMLLVKQFTGELSRLYGRRPPRYSVAVRNLLKAYSWPGNLTELKNFCLRMVVLLPGRSIQPENLPIEIQRAGGRPATASAFTLPAEGVDLTALEGEMIRQALGMSGGNRSRAARLLRISRDTLLYRIQKHAIEL